MRPIFDKNCGISDHKGVHIMAESTCRSKDQVSISKVLGSGVRLSSDAVACASPTQTKQHKVYIQDSYTPDGRPKGQQVPVHGQQTLVPKIRRRYNEQLPEGHTLKQLRQGVHSHRPTSHGGHPRNCQMHGGLPNFQERLVETIEHFLR